MARCLVTGHKGYIGSRLYKKLKDLGHEVMGIDLEEDTPQDIIKELRESNGKIFNQSYYNFQPEYIFHLACWPRVGYSVEHPVETSENNILAGSIVLNFARKVGAKRVIYSSSSSVVGNGHGPTNPYGLQKYVTELEAKLYSELYGIDTVSLRYFNVYSHDQTINGPYATAVSNWMHSIKNNIQPFITGNGEQRRDMVNVEDVISANIFCMYHTKYIYGSAYDIGTGENISLNEIKNIVLKHFPEVEFKYIESRPGEVAETRADPRPLRTLDWHAKISIERGINNCFERLKGEI